MGIMDLFSSLSGGDSGSSGGSSWSLPDFNWGSQTSAPANTGFSLGDYTTPSAFSFGGLGSGPSPSFGTVDMNNGTQLQLPESTANSTEGPGFWGKIGDWVSSNPDKALGAGANVLGGIGGALEVLQRNKMAKKAQAMLAQQWAMQQAQYERMKAIQAKMDPYNYSVDTNTAGSYSAPGGGAIIPVADPTHYGERSGNAQQVAWSPGTTTRTPLASGGLACMADGGKPKKVVVMGDPNSVKPFTGGGLPEGVINALASLGALMRPSVAPQGNGDPYGASAMANRYADGGQAFVSGGAAGQADTIPAQLSDGEYVMDADTVASLGDGNSAAGASKLDQMRQNIRSHKRQAPSTKIPPKAKNPLAYLPKKGK